MSGPAKSGRDPSSDPLRERWTTNQGRALAEEAFRRLAAGEHLDGLPLARHEGRVDLRAVVGPHDPEVAWHRTRKMGEVTLEGLDLSGAELPSWYWSRTTVLNCRFDGANIEDLGTWATRVEDTSFRGTRGQTRCLGAVSDGVHGVFRNVDFSRADLRVANAGTADFVDCDFSHARTHKTHWGQARFIRCRFAGLVRENIWYGRSPFVDRAEPNEMEDVDFSAAELRWSEFRHLVLDRVRLPEDANHIIIRGDCRQVLVRLIEIVRSTQELALTGFAGGLDSMLAWLHRECRVQVFNVKDLAETDRGKGLLAPLIRRVAAEVGATAT